MLSKLPRWVWLGAGILAFSAGMVNAIALLGFTHQAATHVTGIFSRLSIAVLEINAPLIKHFTLIILSFFLGAVLSGIIIRDAHLKMGRRYGFALAIECLFLLASTYGFYLGSPAAEYFACMAAGLQNAMVSTYSGAIVRTTHLTGVVTDLGILAGHWIQGVPLETRRIQLFLVIMLSFFTGGFAGALAYTWWDFPAMLVPAGIIGISSTAYTLLQKKPL